MSMAEHQSQTAAVHHRAGQGGKGTERTITPKQYFTVAAILAVVTALEVAVVYIEAMRPVLVPALLFLSFLKFLFVVMYRSEGRRVGIYRVATRRLRAN